MTVAQSHQGIVSSHQGNRSQYEQNAQFLNQLNGGDRHNMINTSAGQNGIYNGCPSQVSIGTFDRNMNLNNGGNEGTFQYMMLSKPSSRMQVQETVNISNTQENLGKSPQTFNRQMTMIQNQNQKSNNVQRNINQNQNNSNCQTMQSRGQLQREPGQQLRNSSQPEYKQFRQRAIAKQHAQASLRGGSDNQDVDPFNSAKQLMDNKNTKFMTPSRPTQQQIQMINGQPFINMPNNQSSSATRSGGPQMHIPGAPGPQTPQQPGFQQIPVGLNNKIQNNVLQKQQLMKGNQLFPQSKEQFLIQLMQQNKQPNQTLGNEGKFGQVARLFSNQVIQNRAQMTRNQSEESQRQNGAGGYSQSQQQMRNSQQLVEAAEQLFIQKQMYLQMLQSISGGQGTTQPCQMGLGRQPQIPFNFANVQDEFKTLQEYQRAFNKGLLTNNDHSSQTRTVQSNAQEGTNNDLQALKQKPQDMPETNQILLKKTSATENGQPQEYFEFQDYLLQQQFEQEGDYPQHFAHSKKQRELLKAKEFSQQYIARQDKKGGSESKDRNNYHRSESHSKNKQFKSEKQKKNKKLNDLCSYNQEDHCQGLSPRGTSGSKRSKRKGNKLTATNQFESQHARSQSGNECRERHQANMVVNSQLNSAVLFMQRSNNQAGEITQKQVDNSKKELLDDQQVNYRSNTSNNSNNNVTSAFQRELLDKECLPRDQPNIQVTTSQRISSTQAISANTGTTTTGSLRGSLPETKENVQANNTSNQIVGSIESRESPSSSEVVKNQPSDSADIANCVGSVAKQQEDNGDNAQAQQIQNAQDQQLSKVSEESQNDEAQDACGPLVESEDGDPEMLDAIDEESDGEGDMGELEGDSDDNDVEEQDQDCGTKPQNKGTQQNVNQSKGVKSKKDNKKVDEEPAVKEKKPAVPRAPWRLKKEEKAKEAAEKAKAEGQAKPKKNNKILASMPANWAEEEKKFFDANFDYDPQFVYDSPATNKRFLKMFPAPKFEYLPQAKQIIDKFLETYGSESNYFETEGIQLTEKEQVEKYIHDYLDELGPEVKAVARINFSQKNVASTSVTYDNWTNKIRINVQLPIQYREGRMLGVLHHEIGSHFLRRFNEVQQVWHNERKKFGLKSTVTIEEGSGCINMMLEQSKDPKKFTYLFKPALNYYMCCKASELSFKDLFNDLAKYVDNPRTRYKYVLRVKRGLNDTSQPGGLYKDQVYLEGALKLLEHRKEIDWHAFYSAKLNLEDLKRKKLMKQLKTENVVLPKFVENVEEYVKCLDVIASHNL